MFLTKNKLKKIKKPIDDDDMLNYLKYAHIEHKPIDDTASQYTKNVNNNTTQFLETKNKSTQTKDTVDKGVDTGNDFNEVIPPYVSFMHSEDFDRNEKMVQVWTKMFKQNLTSPPSSSSNSSGGEGFPSKMVRGGFRLAEYAFNASMAGINIADAVIDMITSAPHHSSSDEEVIQPNTQQEEVISVHSSPPISVHSSPPISVQSSLPPLSINSSSASASTVPIPTSPQTSRASSAKTTPRKTSK